jgi:CubicO group peptidase (beta-lactamase class C family)
MTRFNELDRLVSELAASGKLADAQYAFGRNNELVTTKAFGQATLDSRFCIFSSTKPIFAALVWRLLDDRRLTLQTKVVDVWPEFGAGRKERITIEDLLLFTAGIPRYMIARDAVATRETRAQQMEQWQVEWEPGSQFAYHPFSAGWVLSEVVARVTGMDHTVALRKLVLDPLGITRLELGVPAQTIGDLRPVDYIRTAPFDVFEAVTGQPSPPPQEGEEPFDIRQFANDPVVIAAGAPGGGAISDAASVALFYQALLHNPGRLWSPEILADATANVRNRMPDALRMGAPANRTIGLIIATDENPRLQIPAHGIDLLMHPFGPAVSPSTFGHGGGGGQIAFADPTTGISFCFLSNVIDRDAFGAFQNQQDIIAAAVAAMA